MAKQVLYDWGDGNGKIHTKSKAAHDAAVGALSAARTTPPPGTYDPNLDAQQRASGRGLSQLVEDIGADTGTQRVRAQQDLITGQTQLGQSYTRGTEDYGEATQAAETNYGRSLADLLTQRTQGAQDYGSNIATLDRNYQRLGSSQNEAARKAGAFAGSGAQAQGERKRIENEAIDRAPIDTAYQRFTSGSQLGEQRLGEDKATTLQGLLQSFTRGNEDLSAASQGLNRDYSRQGEDWTTQLQRAGVENTQFGIDTAAAKAAQATQLGWKPGGLTSTKPPVKKKPRVKLYTTGVKTP
jgi:hypothetical protein